MPVARPWRPAPVRTRASSFATSRSPVAVRLRVSGAQQARRSGEEQSRRRAMVRRRRVRQQRVSRRELALEDAARFALSGASRPSTAGNSPASTNCGSWRRIQVDECSETVRGSTGLGSLLHGGRSCRQQLQQPACGRQPRHYSGTAPLLTRARTHGVPGTCARRSPAGAKLQGTRSARPLLARARRKATRVAGAPRPTHHRAPPSLLLARRPFERAPDTRSPTAWAT